MLNYFTVFSRVMLWNRTRERAERLRDELRELFPEVEIIVASTSVDCVRDADVIVTATNSSEPLFELNDLHKQNVHINGKFCSN
jgi:ornithine cyclodeaminase/alanine dehydrogenase-like protein (mu-crystallin family)